MARLYPTLLSSKFLVNVEQQCGVAIDGLKLEALVPRTSPLGHWLKTLFGASMTYFRFYKNA